jgi:hypothetical protein
MYCPYCNYPVKGVYGAELVEVDGATCFICGKDFMIIKGRPEKFKHSEFLDYVNPPIAKRPVFKLTPRDKAKHHTVTFVPSGRGKAQNPPDPQYPNGMDVGMVEVGDVAATCLVELPYPAPECGRYHVDCSRCDISIALSVAGRVDDPKTVRIKCLEVKCVLDGQSRLNVVKQ